jgi:hypothetical protein
MNKILVCPSCSPVASFIVRKRRIHVRGVYLPSLVDTVCCRGCMRIVGLSDEVMASITLTVKRRQLKDPSISVPTVDEIASENNPK